MISKEHRIQSIPLVRILRKGLDALKMLTPGYDYTIWVVSPKGFEHSDAFYDVALCLKSALQNLSITAPIVRDHRRIKGRGIVLGTNLIPKFGIRNLPKNLILFNLEQIQNDSCWVNEPYLRLLKTYPVWDYSPNNIKELRSLSVKDISHCGLGYETILTRIKKQEENIDVLFYGSPNQRRDRILNELRNKGVKVVQLFGVYGKKRDTYISMSKIVLNIHYYEASIFEAARISFLLANKKCVISEIGKDLAIEAPYREGLIFTGYNNLVETCLDYLRNKKKREAIAEKGFQVIKDIRQTDFLKPLVIRK